MPTPSLLVTAALINMTLPPAMPADYPPDKRNADNIAGKMAIPIVAFQVAATDQPPARCRRTAPGAAAFDRWLLPFNWIPKEFA
jgi:hypothetical protein